MEMDVVVDKWLHTSLTAALVSVNQLHDAGAHLSEEFDQ